MSATDAYGGARMCLAAAREAETWEEALDWYLKSYAWREIARAIRRRK